MPEIQYFIYSIQLPILTKSRSFRKLQSTNYKSKRENKEKEKLIEGPAIWFHFNTMEIWNHHNTC